MGKRIAVEAKRAVGDIVVFDTDRSVTGQDGVGFATAASAADAGTIPGRLAARLFETIPGLSHVFVASSQVVLRRSGGWDDAAVAAAGDVISGFFVFYR